MIQKAAAVGNWWLAASSWQHAHSCITSHAELFGKTSNHPGDLDPYSPDLAPCDFWLFSKLKSPLKGKRFQTVSEIQENTTGQLMEIGRTVWGPKVPTLKRTEMSLSYVQYFFYIFCNKCLYFSYYMAGCLLDRPHIHTKEIGMAHVWTQKGNQHYLTGDELHRNKKIVCFTYTHKIAIFE